MIENSLELLDYVYQGPDRYVRLTKNEQPWKGALINSFKIINSLFEVQYVATLNGHVILDEKIPRLDKPNYYFEE